MTITAPEAHPAADPTMVALKVEEAARRLDIGRTTMYALIRAGEVETIEIGSLRRVPAEALIEYVRRRRIQKSVQTPVIAA